MESTKDKEWDCGNGKKGNIANDLDTKKGKESVKKLYKLWLNARGGGGCGRNGHGVIILAL